MTQTKAADVRAGDVIHLGGTTYQVITDPESTTYRVRRERSRVVRFEVRTAEGESGEQSWGAGALLTVDRT